MTLRRRLLLAQVPLAAALLLVGAASLRAVAFLGDSSETILQDNYRSVLAAQRMGDALDGLDREALLRALGRPDVEPVQPLRDRFESELRVQEGNVTEPGEGEATARLRAAWNGYRAEERRQGARARSSPPTSVPSRSNRSRSGRPSTKCWHSTRTRWCARATRRAAMPSGCSSS